MVTRWPPKDSKDSKDAKWPLLNGIVLSVVLQPKLNIKIGRYGLSRIIRQMDIQGG
jgi:hypothetical protein